MKTIYMVINIKNLIVECFNSNIIPYDLNLITLNEINYLNSRKLCNK